MSYYKDRLTTTITASLLEWRLRGNGFIEGKIARSFDVNYRDGDKYILNGMLIHYSHNEGFWPDHFILSTNTGCHFYLDSKEQLCEPLA